MNKMPFDDARDSQEEEEESSDSDDGFFFAGLLDSDSEASGDESEETTLRFPNYQRVENVLRRKFDRVDVLTRMCSPYLPSDSDVARCSLSKTAARREFAFPDPKDDIPVNPTPPLYAKWEFGGEGYISRMGLKTDERYLGERRPVFCAGGEGQGFCYLDPFSLRPVKIIGGSDWQTSNIVPVSGEAYAAGVEMSTNDCVYVYSPYHDYPEVQTGGENCATGGIHSLPNRAMQLLFLGMKSKMEMGLLAVACYRGFFIVRIPVEISRSDTTWLKFEKAKELEFVGEHAIRPVGLERMGDLLVLGGETSSGSLITLSDVHTGHIVRSLREEGSNSLTGLACHPERDLLLAAKSHRAICLWSHQTSEVISSMPVVRQPGSIVCCPERDLVLVGVYGGAIEMIDLRMMKTLRVLRAHRVDPMSQNAVHMRSILRMLGGSFDYFSACESGEVTKWNLKGRVVARRSHTIHRKLRYSCLLDPNQSLSLEELSTVAMEERLRFAVQLKFVRRLCVSICVKKISVWIWACKTESSALLSDL